jgi:glycosyltransferase involved in cell wall biosynthesis
LRAVAYLEERDASFQVEIVGDGSRHAAWRDLAVQLGIAERVTFHGFVDDDALVAAYARCDVFCMPSIAELQSLATMEAMAAGKPVVAADAMALPHLVQAGRNGWLYPPGDIPALAQRLHDLLGDASQLARMGHASREIITGHSLDRTLTQFEEIYRRARHVPQPVTAVRRPSPVA